MTINEIENIVNDKHFKLKKEQKRKLLKLNNKSQSIHQNYQKQRNSYYQTQYN